MYPQRASAVPDNPLQVAESRNAPQSAGRMRLPAPMACSHGIASSHTPMHRALNDDSIWVGDFPMLTTG